MQHGDVLLGEASGSPAHVGKSAFWNDEIPGCCFQNTVIRFRPHALFPKFALVVFRYFLATGVFARAAHGVGIQHLGASRFAQLEVPVPGMAEQARIVEETNRRLAHVASANESLESALQGIEDQVTTVIEAAATGQVDALRGTTGSETDVATRKQPETANDALAQISIPSSWAWSVVNEVGEAKKGKVREPKHEQGEHVIPYLRVANVFEDRIEAADLLSMNFTPQEQEVYRLRQGDILLNEGQSPTLVGRPAMYRGVPENVCFQNHLIRFRASPSVNPAFALLVFRHYFRIGVFRAIARWTTNIATLGLKRFADLPFPLPPRHVQDELVTLASARLKQLEEQHASVLGSRIGIDEMRREIYAAAVRGDLSNRQPGEESAADMMARLGPPPKEPRHAPAPRASVDAASLEEEDEGEEHQSLTSVIKQNSGRMPAEDAFAAAGYDRDLTREVESFYLSLRDVMGKTVRAVGSDGGRSILEVIPDATQ